MTRSRIYVVVSNIKGITPVANARFASCVQRLMLEAFGNDQALLCVAHDLHSQNPYPSDVVPSVELRYGRAYLASIYAAFEFEGIDLLFRDTASVEAYVMAA